MINNGLHIDAFLRDLGSGHTTLLSRTPDGSGSHGDSIADGISADGRFVVFGSNAADLVPDDTNGARDVFLFDRDNQSVSLVSRGFASDSSAARISRNGRFILFESKSGEAGATNDRINLYLHDREQGETRLVSANWANTGVAKSDSL